MDIRSVILNIVCAVIEVDDASLTKYQIEALLNIISELPEIEQGALRQFKPDEVYDKASITGRALQNLKGNEMFVQVASLGTMSTAELANILTALITGQEDEFGYWETVPKENEETSSESTEIDPRIKAFLDSRICYGRPQPDFNSDYVDNWGTPYGYAFIKLLQTKGMSIDDSRIIWLNPQCRTAADTLYARSIRNLLRSYVNIGKIEFSNKYDRIVADDLDNFFKFWLGDDYAQFAN